MSGPFGDAEQDAFSKFRRTRKHHGFSQIDGSVRWNLSHETSAHWLIGSCVTKPSQIHIYHTYDSTIVIQNVYKTRPLREKWPDCFRWMKPFFQMGKVTPIC